MSPSPSPDLQRRRAALIAAWQAARDEELAAEDPKLAPRERRMDLDRRAGVLARVQEVVDERLAAAPVDLTGTAAARRVVVAHRSPWFTDRLRDALAGHGVEVLAVVDDGADAIGTTLVELPDAVVVESVLQRVTGVEVVRELRRYAPEVVVTGFVPYEADRGALLDAGAAEAWSRSTTPDALAAQLAALLDGPGGADGGRRDGRQPASV